MNKLFLALAILATLSKLKAQIVLERNELKTININNFADSKFYKAFKSTPKVSTMIGSGRTMDGYCIDINSTSYFFKQENILFKFAISEIDTSQGWVLSDIYINSRNDVFITEDSIKVGDKVLLSLLSKDIKTLKKGYIKKKNKFLVQIYHNGVYYELKRIRTKNINTKTIVIIKSINIRPYSETPNH